MSKLTVPGGSIIKRITAIALALFALSAIFFHYFAPGKIDPKLVYENHFTTPLAQISGLTGDGFYFQGGDLWLRFESRAKVEPREAASYAEVSPESARDYFITHLTERAGQKRWYERFGRGRNWEKDLAALRDTRNLTCLYRSNKTSSGRVHYYWILANRPAGVYYSRFWTAH